MIHVENLRRGVADDDPQASFRSATLGTGDAPVRRSRVGNRPREPGTSDGSTSMPALQREALRPRVERGTETNTGPARSDFAEEPSSGGTTNPGPHDIAFGRPSL